MRTCIKVLVGLLFCCLLSGNSIAQTTSPPFGKSAGYTSVAISTAGVVLSFDQSSVNWIIHPVDGNVRCLPGTSSGNPPPTAPSSSNGFQYLSGGYFSALVFSINPQLEIDCAAESGTVHVDVWRNFK